MENILLGRYCYISSFIIALPIIKPTRVTRGLVIAQAFPQQWYYFNPMS
jgi:hypothetical protein